jgi:hypothetical protein
MTGLVRFLGAVTLGVVLGSSCVANAQTVQNAQTAHHRVRHPVAAGHQIIVHPRESYLTAGVGASFGSHNGYVLDTLNPLQRDTIQGTFVGLRGSDRLPNRFTVPGSEAPLFYLSLPLPGSNEPLVSF